MARARVLVLLLMPGARGVAPRPLPFAVVDTHTHFTDPSVLHYAANWTTQLHLPANYSADSAGSALPSSSVVFMEAAVEPDENIAEAAWVQSLADRQQAARPGIGAICAFVPVEKGYAATVAAVRALRARAPLFRCVRRLLDRWWPRPTPSGADLCWFNNAEEYDVEGGLRALADHGVSFELIVRPQGQYTCVPELVARAPSNLTIVLQHLGGPNMGDPTHFGDWSSMVTALSAHRNVVAKLSGAPQLASAANASFDSWTRELVEPYVTHVVDKFGFSRCVYGGNWFMVTRFSTYARWASTLLDIVTDFGASPADLHSLFRDNARKVYRMA